MPRRPRLSAAGIAMHVIQRGNNRSACFHADGDYRCYLAFLGEAARTQGVAIHAYVLMTNHVHLLVTPGSDDAASLMMKFLGQRYVQYVNRRYERTGSLWEGRFRSCLVEAESYLLTCHRYIELNPVRAGMVCHPAEHAWSSYRANAHGAHDELLTRHPVVDALAQSAPERCGAYRQLFETCVANEAIEEIRATTNGGFALGSSAFQDTLGKRLGRRVTPGRRGRVNHEDQPRKPGATRNLLQRWSVPI